MWGVMAKVGRKPVWKGENNIQLLYTAYKIAAAFDQKKEKYFRPGTFRGYSFAVIARKIVQTPAFSGYTASSMRVILSRAYFDRACQINTMSMLADEGDKRARQMLDIFLQLGPG